MKAVYFDVDGTLISQMGDPRPFVDTVIRFCVHYKIRVFVWSANGAEYAKNVIERRFPQVAPVVAGYFSKDDVLDPKPPFVIDDDDKVVKEYGGLLVPYFHPKTHTEFYCLEIASRMQNAIKNFFLTDNRDETPRKTTKLDKPDEIEDTSQYGFAI